MAKFIEMKNLINELKKELILKLDFEKMEFEIGWIWIIILVFGVICI